MINEISKSMWKEFFDEISGKYAGTETRIEVFKDDLGAQVLTEGLPLIGFTFEEKGTNEGGAIEIMLGSEPGTAHQTHTISAPEKVFFDSVGDEKTGVIEIEDESGAKTIVYLAPSASVFISYEEVQITT
jgi:hypothetical protein